MACITTPLTERAAPTNAANKSRGSRKAIRYREPALVAVHQREGFAETVPRWHTKGRAGGNVQFRWTTPIIRPPPERGRAGQGTMQILLFVLLNACRTSPTEAVPDKQRAPDKGLLR